MKKISEKEKKRIIELVVLTSKEFFAGAEKSTLFEDVYNELEEQRKKEGIICGCQDPAWRKRNRDWSELANKVVGCE